METEIIEEIYLPESCVGPGGKVALHCCADGADAANPFPPECPHRRAEILPSSLRKYFSQFNGWNWTKQAPKSAQKKNGIASRHTHTHTHTQSHTVEIETEKERIDWFLDEYSTNNPGIKKKCPTGKVKSNSVKCCAGWRMRWDCGGWIPPSIPRSTCSFQSRRLGGACALQAASRPLIGGCRPAGGASGSASTLRGLRAFLFLLAFRLIWCWILTEFILCVCVCVKFPLLDEGGAGESCRVSWQFLRFLPVGLPWRRFPPTEMLITLKDSPEESPRISKNLQESSRIFKNRRWKVQAVRNRNLAVKKKEERSRLIQGS